MDSFNIILNVLSLVAILGSAWVVINSKVKSENLNDLKDRVEILEKERDESRQEHLANKESIAMLQGKLDAYREIPLKFIPEALEALIKSNNQILETLKGNVKVKKDGLLVHTKEK